MQREITPIYDSGKVILQQSKRSITPFGGIAVFFEFLGKLGYAQKIAEHMPFRLKSPNAIDPAHTFKAGLDTPTMSRIRIANPQPGSAKYTTASRAERYVRRNEAVMIDGELHFLTPAEKWRMQTFIQTIQSERRASDVYIRGIVWWNGNL